MGMTIEAQGQTAGQVEKKTWEEKKQSAHSKRDRSWRQERKENYPSPLQKRELGEKKEKEKLFTCCKGERSWKENN